jgi:hypothetical protein
MLQDRTAKDLVLLTLVKAAAIAIIYYACFAAYDGQPIDTVTHLLGPSSVNAAPQKGH